MFELGLENSVLNMIQRICEGLSRYVLFTFQVFKVVVMKYENLRNTVGKGSEIVESIP